MTEDSARKPIIVTISGDLGSGKSVLTTALVEAFGAERYSTGLVQRQLAEEMGITTLELNQRAETDKSIDDRIDSVFRSLAETLTNLVVDSRMAFHFLPESFRIKLEVHPKVAAQRISKDTSRIGEGVYNTLEDIEAAVTARKTSERERFKRYYKVDIADHAGYSLIINTTAVSREVVNETAIACIKNWQAGGRVEKLWISPKHLYCQESPAHLNDAVVENHYQNWPSFEAWPHDAVEAAKVGPLYTVTKGAEWVAAALRGQHPIIPVKLSSQEVLAPFDDVTALWEKLFDYKHL